ncbi:MAG: vitamin K epoxide reductase family protein [Pyrinomonadaceae bacterium]
MTAIDLTDPVRSGPTPKLPIAAAIVAVIGIVDSVYLTVHHFTAEPVPCSIIEGCEQVLTSAYAEVGGIPLAAFGAAAYFIAFSLAILTIFGDRRMWKLFGIHVTLMAFVSGWLVYVQAALIGAFCQFCLISALTTLILFLIYLISIFITHGSTEAAND